MKKSFLFLILSILAISLSSCASLMGNNSRRISVDSDPEGASVFVAGRYMGVTPTSASLPSYIYGGTEVVFSKPGYEDATVTVDTELQPITFLNILFPPGFIIDVATGDIVKIDSLSTTTAVQLKKTK